MNNSIRIYTFDKICSGIILPCKYEGEKKSDYYIILTTLHLISDIKNKSLDEKLLKEDWNKYIQVDIFDDTHQKIEYKIKDVFIGNSILKEDDVFAMLLEVKEQYKLNINNKVYINNLKSKEIIVTHCYPGIIRNEYICNKIYLKGILNESKEIQNEMKSYRIVDDYHHYEDLKDLYLLQGISGAPVTLENDKIIGMNQSIPYFKGGENPFKTVYFITINHILKYLRDYGCIIYDILDDKITIRWIYRTEPSSKGKNLSILVVGSSGAGKSSFIKSFALHDKFIDSSGDGQTTRSNIEYKYSIYENNPKAKVKFYTKKEFVENRINDIWLDIISFIFVFRYGFKEYDIYEDNLCYFKEIYSKFSILKEIEELKNENDIKSILNLILPLLYSNDKEYYLDIVEYYLKILDMIDKFINKLSLKKMRYIFNNDELYKLYMDIIESSGKNNLYKGINIHVNKEEIFKKIVKYIYKNKDFDYDINNNFTKEKIKKRLIDIISNKKGFFSIKEFLFLNVEIKKEELEEINEYVEDLYLKNNKYIEEIIDKIIFSEEKNNYKENKYEEILHKNLKKIYEELYEDIKKNLEQYLEMNDYNIIITRKEDEICDICFSFEYLSSKERDLLSRFLKVVTVKNQNESLTSIVKKVIIKDSFSDKFSMLFFDTNVNGIKFLDTRGLDHIEKGNDKKRLLQDFITEVKLDREKDINKAVNAIDAMFYLKKLDSGKPTELENIIPIIYEIVPSVSLYCIFTGIDIFYQKNTPYCINWNKKDSYLPKSVQYIFSSELKDSMLKKLIFSEERNKNIYFTLSNNIGAYCNIDDDIFKINNRENIKKILISIIIKEKDNIDIISEDVSNKLKNINKDINKNVKEELENLLYKFFLRASVLKWDYINGNTAKANARRIKEKLTLGYWGVDRYRWDLLFNDAYDYVFSRKKYTSNFINSLGSNKEKLESIIINLKENFLGKSVYLYEFEVDENNEFRNLLESLYDKNTDKNPFNKNIINVVNVKDKDNSREYLNEVVNFFRLVKENNEIFNRFVNLYIEKLEQAITDDRRLSIENILKYKNIDKDIKKIYDYISEIFNAQDDANKAKNILNQAFTLCLKNN